MIETWMAEDHYSRKIKVRCHGEERTYTRTPKQLFAVYDFYVFGDENPIRMKAKPIDECDY